MNGEKLAQRGAPKVRRHTNISLGCTSSCTLRSMGMTRQPCMNTTFKIALKQWEPHTYEGVFKRNRCTKPTEIRMSHHLPYQLTW